MSNPGQLNDGPSSAEPQVDPRSHCCSLRSSTVDASAYPSSSLVCNGTVRRGCIAAPPEHGAASLTELMPCFPTACRRIPICNEHVPCVQDNLVPPHRWCEWKALSQETWVRRFSLLGLASNRRLNPAWTYGYVTDRGGHSRRAT
eukprot:scaffold544_cov320-Pavlova_lutheri.AAC.85